MNQVKIAVWLEGKYTDPNIGGGFSYYNRLISGIDNYSFSKGIEVCFVAQSYQYKDCFKKEFILLPHRFHYSILDKIIIKVLHDERPLKKRIIRRESIKENTDNYRTLREHGVQIIYYPIQMQYHLDNFPFISTNWDVGHRSTYAFPEVTHLVFDQRENYYNCILPKALMVFCESESGKKELIEYTSINENRIKVVPIFAGNIGNRTIDLNTESNVLKTYNLRPKNYFFYPAQFWAHKNHYNLLRAFREFRKEFSDYQMVFTGGDQGNKTYIERCILEMGLSNNVKVLGFVDDEMISILYKNATSLIMPTLMGPTNMPPLEAMALGCPIICSDLPGHREELGEAAIYVDAVNPDCIASAMKKMHNERSEYVKRMLYHNNVSSFKFEYSLDCINRYFEEIASIRMCWD